MDAPFPAGMIEDIKRVVKEDTTASGLNLYPCVFSAPLMFPLQRKEELKTMLQLARTVKPQVIMEIGADKGGGCYHWLKGIQPARFCGIEIRGVPYAPIFSQAFQQIDCFWLGASSYAPETVRDVKRWLDGATQADKIDVLFIDGDKSAFLQDFECYLPMMREGGIVFMHDVRDPDPGRAFRVAAQNPRVRSAVQFENTIEVLDSVEREMHSIASESAHENWLRHWRGRSCGVGVLWV